MERLFTSLIILNLALLSGLAFGASSYEEGVAELSKSIVADAAKFKKQKLAAVDFTDLSGNVTELGRFLAEELSVSLVITGSGLEIVDRTQLNKILQEQALSFSGVIEPAAVKKVGQLAGVDALIAGTITDMGDTLRLTLKIIATDTGSLVAAARATIPKTGTIARLMEREVSVQRMPEAAAGTTPPPGSSRAVATGPVGQPPISPPGIYSRFLYALDSGEHDPRSPLADRRIREAIRRQLLAPKRSSMGVDGGTRESLQLMAEAGYPNGFEIRLSLSIFEGGKAEAAEVQKELKKIGIRMSIVP